MLEGRVKLHMPLILTLRVWIWVFSWLPSLVVTEAAMTCAQ